MAEKLNKPVKEFKENDYLWAKPGAPCWMERDAGDQLGDEDVFIASEIVSMDVAAKKVVVDYKTGYDGVTEVNITRISSRDPQKYPQLTDLVDLPTLNDAELHQKIKERFAALNIFTYIGPSLLIMNPFRYIPAQYKEELKKSFYNCCFNPNTTRVRDYDPHVWAIASHSYTELFATNRNQAICISGESGAGKTVNAKGAMAFLTGMNDRLGGAPTVEGESKIEDKILMCNPILEALGNAKTVRNDNSSRFGKYISLFIENKMIVGASTKSYLLEAIRVTKPNQEERNYHIFYQLLQSSPEELVVGKLLLDREPSGYPYLERSGCYEVNTINDDEEFGELMKSMKTLNLIGDIQECFWRILAAILHASQIDFDESDFNESDFCPVATKEPFEKCAKVLGVTNEMLHSALTSKTRNIQGKVVTTYFDRKQSLNATEAFSKDIYSKMFDWVIKYLNLALLPEKEKKSGQDPEQKYKKIGLLDIFGFEIFNFNSIEQLCINFTNEKLHQLYIEYVFKLEQLTFINEGLKEFLGNLQFNDNQDIIDVLASDDKRKFSIFNLIDDKSATNGKDDMLVADIQRFHKQNDKVVQFSRFKKNVFVIQHTAKPVEYTSDGFIEKNKDEVAVPIIHCVVSSSFEKIVDIYCLKIHAKDKRADYLSVTKKRKENFIGYKFRQQMEALMTELRSCDCSFMRCIKPNEMKSDTIWTPTMVVNQIRYLGLLDSIRIRRESYPFRFKYQRFVVRYLELEPTHNALSPEELSALSPDYIQLAKNITGKGIPDHGTDTLLFGTTTVFMKSEAYEELERVYEETVKVKKQAILNLDKVLLQVVLKSQIYDFRRKGMVTVDICRKLLGGFSGKQEALDFIKVRKVVRNVQQLWRRKNFQIQLAQRKNDMRDIQTSIQAFVAQKQLYKKVEKVRIISNAWWNHRRYVKFKLYVDMMFKVLDLANNAADTVELVAKTQSAVTIQRFWRGALVRMRYQEEVMLIRKARDDFLVNRAKATIKRFLRGKLERAKIKKIQRAATYIQAYMKMRWTSAYYQKMRRAAIAIQRALKDGLQRKVERKNRRIKYLEEEYIPFLRSCYNDQSKLYSVDIGSDDELEEGLTIGQWEKETPYSQVPQMEVGQLSKAKFFCEVIDSDYINDVRSSYQDGWSHNYIDAHKEAMKLKTDVRVIEVGSTHTAMATSLGRFYCWGDNDELQLGSPQEEETMSIFRVMKGEEKLRNVATGSDHTIILTKNKAVFTYGNNDLGQLALEDNEKHQRIELSQKLTKSKLASVYAKGEESFGITGDGKLLFWPISSLDPSIGLLSLPKKHKAKTLTLGEGFVVILTEKGYIYSYGERNESGQLGLGHTYPVSQPTFISSIARERIVNVAAGSGHCLALTRNSKMFAWGAGSDGQLGLGSTDDFLNPTAIRMALKSSRIIQVAASFRGSYALTGTGSIYWWGRNSRIRMVTRPSLFRVCEEEFFPVQVRSSWSENFSVAYIIYCDLRCLEGMNISEKRRTASNMAKKWSEGISKCKKLGQSQTPNPTSRNPIQ